MRIPIIKGDKVDSNTDFRDALLVNYYAVEKEIRGATGYILNYYGLIAHGEGSGESRGALWVAREGLEGLYFVSGINLIRIDKDGVREVLGQVSDAEGAGQVSMAYSFNYLAIVSDKKLYYYDNNFGLRQIVNENVGEPIDRKSVV